MLRLGAQRRAIAATDLNERSSRSHTIFSVEVNGATLRLADLAGSERRRTEELRDYSPSDQGTHVDKPILAPWRTSFLR